MPAHNPQRATRTVKELLKIDKELLKKRVKLSSRSAEGDIESMIGTEWEGCTPLMLAAKFGRFGVVKALLEMGANAEVTNKNAHIMKKMTAHDYAVESGNEAVAALLAEHSYNIAIKTGKLQTAIPPSFQNIRSTIRASLRNSVESSTGPSQGGEATKNIW